MRIKQWAVALLLGGFVLSAASCSSKKDEPKKPDTSKTETASLEGTWTVSGVTCSPETVSTDDKEYKVADYVFRSMIFRDQLDAKLSTVKIEGQVVKLISVVDKEEKIYDMLQKDGNFYFKEYATIPVGKVLRDGKQITLSITLTPFILDHASHGKNQDANAALSALSKQNKTLTITITGTK
jgi:lipoprotein